MSVKNCSRDVLVSRYSSQMALDEDVSTNVCKKLFVDSFFWNNLFNVIILNFVNICII